MTDSTPAPLGRDDSDRRVRGLRERLMRAGQLPEGADLSRPEASDFDATLEHAVKSFQQSRGLIADGIVGPETERRLSEAQYTLGDRPLQWDRGEPMRGDDVEQLQQNLSLLGLYYGHLNGSFEERTHLAVLELQQNLGLERTGRVDHRTIEALARINKNITDSKAFSLRDFHNLESANGAVRSRSIVLVPKTMLEEHPRPAEAPQDAVQQAHECSLDVAARAHELLSDIGAHPTVVADRPLSAADGTRIETPRSLSEALEGLDRPVVIVIGCEWNASQRANGVAAFYWGDSGDKQETLSPIGRRGASLIVREMVARTGALDLGCHGREWTILRGTPAATIALDIGYLSNAGEAADLARGEYRAHIAQAIAVGLQRMFARAPQDHPTGTLSTDEIARELQRNARG
ncbi:N-acetylmuramoyl-L-alanine amidase [Kocuria palustris]|uniref:N-acetylmuramoyl-L-alanine amidase n=1 Tax=Kocuria palustris TaxID=71999 RepID=UPI00119CB24A|nr:peptidoglycan-binding protein [Kocuria palustris]